MTPLLCILRELPSFSGPLNTFSLHCSLCLLLKHHLKPFKNIAHGFVRCVFIKSTRRCPIFPEKHSERMATYLITPTSHFSMLLIFYVLPCLFHPHILPLTHFLLLNHVSSKLFSGGPLGVISISCGPPNTPHGFSHSLISLNLLVNDPLGLSALKSSHLYPFFKTLCTTCTFKVYNSVAFCIFAGWHHHRPYLSFEHHPPSENKPSTYPSQLPKT